MTFAEGLRFDDTDKNTKKLSAVIPSRTTKLAPQSYHWKIKWHYVFGFSVMHAIAIYGVYVCLCGLVQFKTIVFALALYYITGLGITAGAHRLWAHRTYKARLPLRVLLAAFQTMAFQYNIFQWVRDHRTHHKYTDTDADPYNASRGFFFSHIGWLMVDKHPDTVAKAYQTDMRDVLSDPVVAWQRKHYVLLVILLALLLPSIIPYWFWNEKYVYSISVVCFLRYLFLLHITFLVNSAAHTWGTKPYDKNITPTENPHVAWLALGEGWHNYHHAFPWDYKAAELGNYRMNITTAFIDAFAFLGLAYDLKSADSAMVAKRCERTGTASDVDR